MSAARVRPALAGVALVVLAAVALVASPVAAGAGAPPRLPSGSPGGAHWVHVDLGSGAEGGPEIVGGTPAADDAYPYQAALVLADTPGIPIRGQFCGGSLISPDTVLTAAHCIILGVWILVDGDTNDILDVEVDQLHPSDFDVLSGDEDLGAASTAERLDVHRVRLDPHFDLDVQVDGDIFSVRLVPDLAIVQLADDASATPVALAVPGQEALYSAGTPATVTGWGLVNALGGPPTRLQQATIPVVSDADCATAYGTDFDATGQVCAGDLAAGLPSPCYGDSGGPLVVDNGGQPLQVGVVMGGDGCGGAERPTIFTRVAAHDDWVGRYLDPDEVPDRPRQVRLAGPPYLASVHVSWRAPEFDGGSAITGYRVKIGGAPVVTVGGSARSADVGVGSLVAGHSYRVTVRAVNAVGVGAPKVSSFRCPGPPGAPCGHVD